MGVDSTQLELNAAMKSIVRKDTGEYWKDYLKRLMLEDGLIDEDDDPSGKELARFDRACKGKKVSNEEWELPTDGDARITRMKDGCTWLGVKPGHTVGLETEIVFVQPLCTARSQMCTVRSQIITHLLIHSVGVAQLNLKRTGVETAISEVAADEDCHTNQPITDCSGLGLPKPGRQNKRRWTDKDKRSNDLF